MLLQRFDEQESVADIPIGLSITFCNLGPILPIPNATGIYNTALNNNSKNLQSTPTPPSPLHKTLESLKKHIICPYPYPYPYPYHTFSSADPFLIVPFKSSKQSLVSFPYHTHTHTPTIPTTHNIVCVYSIQKQKTVVSRICSVSGPIRSRGPSMFRVALHTLPPLSAISAFHSNSPCDISPTLLLTNSALAPISGCFCLTISSTNRVKEEQNVWFHTLCVCDGGREMIEDIDEGK